MKKVVIFGALTGTSLVAAAAGWFTWKSSPVDGDQKHWLKVETSEDKTLSGQFETAPRLPLPPRALGEVAKKLGYPSVDKALEEAQIFEDRITGGYLPNGFREKCATTYQPAFCTALIDDYFGPRLEGSNKISRHRRGRVFSIARVKQLQADDFGDMRASAPNWSVKQVRNFAKEALKTKACPRNFSLVLARSLEDSLDDTSAWSLMDQLDAHGLECLKPDDASAEFVWQRVALLNIARGKNALAVEQLKSALGVQTKKEVYRTLYWLSRLARQAGNIKEADEYVNRLARQYPLAWYTILGRIESKQDPLAFFLGNPNYPDIYDSGDPTLDRRIAWLHMLINLPDAGFAVRKYGEFLIKEIPPTTNPALLQYLARLMSSAGFHRLQIILVNQIGQAQPDFLSIESLKLLYPKPFFEEMDAKSPELDTAILLGLARQESGFDPNARSNANAKGLLQILPSTARHIKKIKKEELYDYAHNIEIGSKYLLSLISQFGGSAEKAFAAYNAGPGNVRKWERRYGFVSDPQLFADLIPFRETRDYVPSILRNAYWYHRLFPNFTHEVVEGKATTSGTLRKLLEFTPLPSVSPSPKSSR